MLDKTETSSSQLSSTCSEIELKQDFDGIFNYIDDCNKFNFEIKEYFENFKNDKHLIYKRKIEEEIKLNKKRERESLNLVNEIKASFERNVVKLKDHHEKQISNIIEKHKLEVQKWKSKYEKIKFDKKVEKVDSDDEMYDKKFLKAKIDKLSKELETLKFENATNMKEMNKVKKENKTLEDDLKELKKDHSKLKTDFESKDKELSQCKSKINSLEIAIKKKEEFIKNQDEKIKAKEIKNEELKSKYDNLNNDYKKLNNESKKSSKDDSEFEKISSTVKDELQCIKSDLILAKTDLRSANRELNKKTDILTYLRQELNEAKAKIVDYETKLNEEKNSGRSILNNLENYKKDIDVNNHKIKNQDYEIMNLKCQIDENSKNMDLQVKELNDAKSNENKWKNKCCEFEKKNQVILSEIECIKRKSAQLKVELDKKSAEINKLIGEKTKLSKRHEELKKVCVELENQVQSFSQKYCEVSSDKKTLIKQKCSVSDEVNNLKKDLESSNLKITKLLKEKEDISNQLINKELEFQNTLTNERIHLNKLIREFDIEQEKCARLEDRISWLETGIEERDREITHLTKDHALVSNKLSLIKEEAAKHITMISMLTKETQQLMDELNIKSKYEKTLLDKVEMFREQLKAIETDSNRDRITWNETFSQQMKLIDYLKNKAEEYSKKKPSIFALRTKDNLMDKMVDVKYEDSQKSFKNKKNKNSKLNEQFKENMKDHKSSLVAEKIKEQYCDNYASNITDSQKKNKPRFISQDSPHNFSSTTVKFTTLCVSCANDIYFGQKAKKCQDCSSTVHLNCNLVNNCGLPVQLVRQAVLDNFNNSFESNSMSHSSQSDDVEPSAPDASLNSSTTDGTSSNIFEEELNEIMNSNKISKKNNIFDSAREEFSFTDSIIDLLDE